MGQREGSLQILPLSSPSRVASPPRSSLINDIEMAGCDGCEAERRSRSDDREGLPRYDRLMAKPRTGRPRAARDRVLILIAVFKFCKAALLVAIGLGALALLKPRTAHHARIWLSALSSSLDRRMARDLIARVSGASPQSLQTFGVVAFFYAALFVIEGLGLWRQKRWAEYLTIVATASLLPFEAYELMRAVTLPRISALVLNLLVVAYLGWRVRPRRGTS